MSTSVLIFVIYKYLHALRAQEYRQQENQEEAQLQQQREYQVPVLEQGRQK